MIRIALSNLNFLLNGNLRRLLTDLSRQRDHSGSFFPIAIRIYYNRGKKYETHFKTFLCSCKLCTLHTLCNCVHFSGKMGVWSVVPVLDLVVSIAAGTVGSYSMRICIPGDSRKY